MFLLAGFLYRLSLEKEPYQRTEVNYQIPDVELLNQRAEPIKLQHFLNSDLPILLNFSFTSCNSICSSESVIFTNFQKRLADPTRVRLVSITIDPEVDTPEVLLRYLKGYGAKPGWDFLTGRKADIQQVMAAFNFKPGDMFTYQSSCLLRGAKQSHWIRIDGQMDTHSLLHEYYVLTL